MMSASKIIFIHSGEGIVTGQHHWFPYAVRKFNEHGLETCNPDFPNPMHPKKDVWLEFLKDVCAPDINSIIIGHSYGAVATMHWAQKHQLLGIVLVGAFYTDLGEEGVKASGFVEEAWDWDAIKSNTKWRVQFHSIDDPATPYKEGEEISKFIDSELHTFTDAMHFGIDGINPYSEFPELVGVVLGKVR